MLVSIALGFGMLFLQQQQVGSIQQKSSGPCTVNAAGIQGGATVTINCPGVGPRAMRVFNEELQKQGQSIKDLADQLKTAEEWRRKYEELAERLAVAGIDNDLARKADELLKEGRLDDAKKILDQLIIDDEKQIDRVAQDYFNRARLNEIKFDPLHALSDYERAYRYRPNKIEYASAYSYLLLGQNQFSQAEDVLVALLAQLRGLAKKAPGAYQPDVAMTLNNLANLYSDTQRMKEAEEAYKEALDIYRALAKANPSAYQPDVAATLNNLAILYRDTQRMKEAEEAHKEALDVRRALAKANPSAYQPDVAMTLNNLAILYKHTQRMKEAEEAYKEALEIFLALAKANPSAYQPSVAGTLNNLAILYKHTQRMKEAEEAYKEALGGYRALTKANPSVYQPYVAGTLNNLAILYSDTQRLKEAKDAYKEALDIYRALAKANPSIYQPKVESTLNALSLLAGKSEE